MSDRVVADDDIKNINFNSSSNHNNNTNSDNARSDEQNDQNVVATSDLLDVIKKTAATIAKASVEQSSRTSPDSSKIVNIDTSKSPDKIVNESLISHKDNPNLKKRKQRINIRNRIEIKDSLNLLGFNGNREHSDEKFKNKILRSLAKTPMVFNQSSNDTEFQENVSVYVTDQRGNLQNYNSNSGSHDNHNGVSTIIPSINSNNNTGNEDNSNMIVITSENAKSRSNFNFRKSHRESPNLNIVSSSNINSSINSKTKSKVNVNLDSTRFIIMDPSKIRKSPKVEGSDLDDGFGNDKSIKDIGNTNVRLNSNYSFSNMQISKEINMVNGREGKMKLQGYLFKHILNAPFQQTPSATTNPTLQPPTMKKSKVVKKRSKPGKETENTRKRNELYEGFSKNNMNQSVISKFRMESNSFQDVQQVPISSMSTISKSFKKPLNAFSQNSNNTDQAINSIPQPQIRFNAPFFTPIDIHKKKFKSAANKPGLPKTNKNVQGRFILKTANNVQHEFINSNKNTISSSHNASKQSTPSSTSSIDEPNHFPFDVSVKTEPL